MEPSGKVLIITDVTAPGGVDTYVCNLELAARKRGWETRVLMDKLPGSNKLYNMLKAGGAFVTRAPLYHRRFGEDQRLNATRDCLDGFLPHIAHAVCGAPWNTIVPREAVLDRDVPLYFTEQYVAPGFYFEGDDYNRIRDIYRRAGKIIAVSGNNAGLLENEYNLPCENLVVIPNAVETDVAGLSHKEIEAVRKRLGLPEKRFYSVSVARLCEQKGLDTLIRAVAEMDSDARGRIHFSIIGEGPMRGRLETLIRETGVGDTIALHGWRDDATALLPAFDLFVLPSRAEGQPFALLEAIAAQRPVIAGAVSGIPELLENDRGVLVEADDAAGLARSLENFVRDPKPLLDMAARARQYVCDYHDLHVNINRTIDLWEN